MSNDTADWAYENFGHAEVGDPRRVARLVSMAAQAASTPAGRVTEVFKSSAEREGAFRLLESAAVSADRVAAAAFEATAQRCNGEKLVYVALDGSTLTLTDRKKHRELGRVGAYAGRGLHVMTALGIDERGTTCGLLAQHWWARTEKRTKRAKCYGKRYLERETRYWLDAINSVQARLTEHAPQTRAWYQLDRGADGWPIFALAVEQQLLLTVRSCHDRRLIDERIRSANRVPDAGTALAYCCGAWHEQIGRRGRGGLSGGRTAA
jgi:hypothetical protein